MYISHIFQKLKHKNYLDSFGTKWDQKPKNKKVQFFHIYC